MLLNLTEKKALIIGVANQKSIAWSIAKQLHQAGATLGFTYLPDPTGKGRFKPKIEAALALPETTPLKKPTNLLLTSRSSTLRLNLGSYLLPCFLN